MLQFLNLIQKSLYMQEINLKHSDFGNSNTKIFLVSLNRGEYGQKPVQISHDFLGMRES